MENLSSRNRQLSMGREKSEPGYIERKGIVGKVKPDQFKKPGVGLIMDDHNYSSAKCTHILILHEIG